MPVRRNIYGAVKAVAGHVLDDTTLLGVAGTFDLDGLLETLVYAAGKLTMTISSTTDVALLFTAALLTGANDFLWVAPNGTHFVGKAQAGANFVTGGVGAYRVFCTDWSKVTGFNTSENNITAVDVAVVTALTNLNLANNLLTAPPVLTGLTALTNLDLSINQLTAPPVLTGLTALTNLDLSINQLTAPPTLTGLTALEYLVLANNLLTTSPTLTGLTALIELYLNENLLTAPPTLTGLTALKYLDLDGNYLTSAGVDAVLAALVAGTVNGGQVYLQQTSAAIPGTQGLLDRATLLAAPRSWVAVRVDS